MCAEHMEEDYVGPRLREKRLRDRARRMKTWGCRRWMRGINGYDFTSSWYLNTEGYHLSLDPVGREWQVYIRHRESGRDRRAKRRHPTLDAAKHAGLDALLWAKEHLPP